MRAAAAVARWFAPGSPDMGGFAAAAGSRLDDEDGAQSARADNFCRPKSGSLVKIIFRLTVHFFKPQVGQLSIISALINWLSGRAFLCIWPLTRPNARARQRPTLELSSLGADIQARIPHFLK